MGTIKDLYQLQLVDGEWDERQRRLDEVAARIGESEDLIRAREAVAEAQEEAHRLRTQMRALDLEVASVNDKLKQNQDRAYSGKVRNPKELTSLNDEAFALRRRRSELEDEQFERMIEIEALDAELSERQARLAQIEAAWRQDQASLQVERGELEQRLAALEAEREQRRQAIGPGDLDLYDDLKGRYGGLAVVRIKRGTCQTCGCTDIPTNVARAVERGEGPHFCPVCNRIMYGG
ncbi:MAG: hypothetical protein JXA93_00160 [Anaerolineae bacterium]|nr:hypothetical protein [Anaerolineae bacterium]